MRLININVLLIPRNYRLCLVYEKFKGKYKRNKIEK